MSVYIKLRCIHSETSLFLYLDVGLTNANIDFNYEVKNLTYRESTKCTFEVFKIDILGYRSPCDKSYNFGCNMLKINFLQPSVYHKPHINFNVK